MTKITMRATPLARRTAAEHGVTLEGLAGTGPAGRITREDVLAAAGVEVAPAAAPVATLSPPAAPVATLSPPAAPVATLPPAAEGDQVRELTRSEQVVARRMTEAKATVPHFQVQTEVAMDEAIALRSSLKRIAGNAPVPSLNDVVVKACALALRDHPKANGSYRDGRYLLHAAVDVGIAVAAGETLVVPTIRQADRLSLGRLAAETRRLAERARTRQVTPAELDGGTFTVSNLGMYGMTAIWPVINVPQAAILGVGAVREELARVDGAIVDRRLVTLTLSCDHRILNGADAARFLADVKDLLEAPLRLVL